MCLDGTKAEVRRAVLADHLLDALIAEPTMLDSARHAVALAQACAPGRRGGADHREGSMSIFVDER